MALTTYMNIGELENYSKIEDKNLDELFQEVRAIFPQYYVQEYLFTISSGFWKTEKVRRYTVYNDLGCEAQILMLPGQYITASGLIAFFLGLINGAKNKSMAAQIAQKE